MIPILTDRPWQMTFGERAALEGILSQLRPELSVEIGTAEGGSLRRIAAHSGAVHSFDLVEPSLPVAEWGDVTLHTGDSHALVPAFLAEVAARDGNVDFVLVDGDHSADGVERDMRDLLESPALRRTVILVHDTLNEEVREGVARVPYDELEHVVHHDLDFVGGHLSRGGTYDLQLWGGLGLVVVDAERREPVAPGHEGEFHDLAALLVPARDALAAGGAPGAVPADPAVHEQLERVRAELATTRAALVNVETSSSWRLTAPLRAAKRLAAGR